MRGPAKLPPWIAELMKELMTPPTFMRQSVEAKKEPEKKQYSGRTTERLSSQSFQPDSTLHSPSGDIKWSNRSSSGSSEGRQSSPKREKIQSGSSSHDNMQSNDAKAVTTSKTTRRERVSSADDTLRRNQAILLQGGIPLQIIPTYGWDVRECESVSNIVKVHAKNGVFALKETHLTPTRIRFLYRLTQYVRQNGFDRVSRFVRNTQKKLFYTDGEKVYYATHWIAGNTANFASLPQVGEVAHALAQFHEASRGFEYSGYTPPMEFHLLGTTKRRVDDLKSLVAEVQQKREFDQFDSVFLQIAPRIIQDADEAVEILGSKECLEFISHDEDTPGICHLDVIPGNFVYDGQKHQAHLLDLDLATYAPRVLDAAHLLRRSLQLQNWNPEVAYVCFLRYSAIREICPEEYQLLHGLLRFPYRAWRLAHTRYRVFADNAQIDDLVGYRNQDVRRQAFLTAFSRELTRQD